MADYRIISADSHLNEPLSLYERLPLEYRERAPHLEERDGKRFLIVEGHGAVPIEAPLPINEDDRERYWRDGEDVGRVMHRGGGVDVEVRIADLEKDGVDAEVIYPHGTFNTFSSPDPAFQLALARVYNDYYHELFGDHGDRFVPSAVLPMSDLDGAIAEVERLAKLGFRSASIPITMPLRPYNLPDYDRFWATVAEMGMPLALHIFTYGPDDTKPEYRSPRKGPGEDLAFEIIEMAAAMHPLCLLTASGVLERHPGLRFVLVECGVGWLAWVLQTLDQIYDKRHMWIEPKLKLRPSEYFKRQGGATFGDDEVGLHNLQVTGPDCLLWGSDYPHDEGTFPHSREVIERTFRDVPAETTRKIVGDNAARMFGFD